jgi:hypothetical protein
MQTETRNAECGTAVDPGVVKLIWMNENGTGISGVHIGNSFLMN